MTQSFSLVPYMLVSLVAAGMALAFVSADRGSPTSLALAVFLLALGMSLSLTATTYWITGSFRQPGWAAIPETVSMMALLEWLLRLRRTVDAGGLDTRTGDALLRAAQLAALVYLGLSFLYPDLRARDFLGAIAHPSSLTHAGFWMFAGLGAFMLVAALASSVLLLNRKPDDAERIRLLAMNLALPFLVGSLIVDWEYVPIPIAIGEMIFLVGAVRYHVAQGARSQFLGRFLAPQVADLVQRRGLASAMQQNLLEITVVCCDLRGFTAYARDQGSMRVIEVLREYYDVIGREAGRHGGTIKDFAGDGILILIGAPLPVTDHARRGLELARCIRDIGMQCTRRWGTVDFPLGLGVGVASGPVTVGIIDSTHRLEYTAVGSAVNLASRLCEEAAAGEVRVDTRTVELSPSPTGMADAAPLALKGFGDAVPNYRM